VNDTDHDVADLATQVEQGANALEQDAVRAGATDSGVAARKRAAAADVRAYAEHLRTSTGPVNADEAQAMALAAQCSGILIDGAGKPPREQAALISLVRQGHMVHVAEPGQIPFFALSSYGGWYATDRAQP